MEVPLAVPLGLEGRSPPTQPCLSPWMLPLHWAPTGALTGLFALLLMTVFQGYADGTRLPRKIHLFTAVAGGAVFRLLIAPLGKKENTPAERNTPPGKSGEEKSPSPRKRGAKSGKSTGKKKA